MIRILKRLGRYMGGRKQSLDKDLIVENAMQVGTHAMISDAVALKTAIGHLD